MLSHPLTLTLALALAFCPPQDLAGDLRHKDGAVREAAARALGEQGGEDAEELLDKALKDDDWGVVIAACDGLQTRIRAHKRLLGLALESASVRVRAHAARAMGRIDATEAADALVKKVSSRNPEAALRALALVLESSTAEVSPKKFTKLVKSELDSVRVPALRCLLAASAPDERADLVRRYAEAGPILATALFEGLAAAPRAEEAALLLECLLRPSITGVVERRARAAALACLARVEETARGELLAAAACDDPRYLRLLEQGAQGGLVMPGAALQLGQALASGDAQAAAAAAKALRALGGKAARDLALAQLAQASSPRVRYQCLETVAALTEGTSAADLAPVISRLSEDEDGAVRERAAVLLGRPGLEAGLPALSSAAADGPWEVAVCALVSLGKTRAPGALAPLQNALTSRDWKLRGAAVIGLMHLAQPAGVEGLLDALKDDHPSVSACARQALLSLSGKIDPDLDAKDWREWWTQRPKGAPLVITDEVRARRERFGYTVPDREIYAGLDVFLIPGRGDHMEGVLERLEIDFESVLAGGLEDSGLHPRGILVAGCTGEVEHRDLEPIGWFVRTGGALFTSCWAVTHTVNETFPGVLRKVDTVNEVLDNVRAYPAAPGSRFLTGVFDGGVVPIYALVGAHLIQVDDPERAQVLIDSPEAAERHGGGDLAAWFGAGHGFVLDSVNHFDSQGLALALGLRKPDERQAYAVDHMGMSFARLRETLGEKWWRSQHKSGEQVLDRSAFRVLTNFVREKRVNGD